MKSTIHCCALTPLHLAVAFAMSGMPALVFGQSDENLTVARNVYTVPAGALNDMLLKVARQSGRTISFDPALVYNYRGSAVNGNMTVEQATAACLQGTDLVLDVTENGTLTVTRSAEPLVVGPTTIVGNDAQLPEISVRGGSLSDDELYYNPSNSSTVSRTDTPLKETAQSVEVISAKALKDRQATDLADALKSSAGVQQTPSATGGSSFTIRGFSVQQTSTNGIPNPGVNSIPVQGIERVEVVKGPDSIMSGSSTPGGTINMVRKAPVTEELRAVSVEVARYGELKEGLDLGGALNEDRSLSYRLNMSNMKSDKSAPDFDGERETYVAPALTWQNDGRRLTVGAESSNTRTAAPRSTIVMGGKLQKLPSERLFPRDNGFQNTSKTGYYEFSQELLGGWSFNSKATYVDGTENLKVWQNVEVEPDGSVGFASPYAARIDTKSWSMQNDVRGKVNTGFFTHKLLLGVDYQHIDSTEDDLNVIDSAGAYPQVNIYDPHSIDLLPGIGSPNYRWNKSRVQQRGLILQDQLEIGDRTHVLLAAKKAEWISDVQVYAEDGTSIARAGDESEKWVPNYGISFDVTPQMTIYANLLHGFSGTSSLNSATGEPLKPLTSKSKEAGVKFNLLNDSLTLTYAYFELEEDNVPVEDPFTRQPIGSQSRSSKGYDLNLAGEILPGWNVQGSYTHVKFEEPAQLDGNPPLFSGEPEQSINVWTSYELQEGMYKGLGAGVGVDAFSGTTGSTSYESYAVPGGASTDISLFYHAQDYSLTLGVKNVFGRTLYNSWSTGAFVPLREERNARLTFTYNF